MIREYPATIAGCLSINIASGIVKVYEIHTGTEELAFSVARARIK